MPNLLHGQCQHCRHDEFSYRSSWSVISESGEVIDLAHPLEGHYMIESGETWGKVGLRGRFLCCVGHPCRNCGGVYTRRFATFPFLTGCFLGAVTTLVALVWSLFSQTGFFHHWLASYLGFAFGFYGGRVFLRILAGVIARAKGIEVSDVHCCSKPSPVRLPYWRWMKFSCPECKEKAYRYSRDMAF